MCVAEDDLASLAEAGDCGFYQKMNEIVNCDSAEENYAIDYGYKYCNRFEQFKGDFDGKVRALLGQLVTFVKA